MKRFIISALATLITATTCTSAIADNTRWGPTDFDGAWVEVFDDAQDGCWTNIGEVKTYATDQLELAGFNVIERPKAPADGQKLSLGKNIMLIIRVEGTRWPDGTCVGSLMTYFFGRVIVVPSDKLWVTSSIGEPYANALWDKDNFNMILFDQIRSFITAWVEIGKIDEDEG